VTVLVHDQRCAAELRRDRSRGIASNPDYRIVINERVCEGCGDCGDKSNCLSVQPVDTPYGRKTRIHQTSCNFDQSCLQGDCPSFATVTLDVEGAKRSKPTAGTSGDPGAGLPDPVHRVPEAAFTVRLSGIGGTGVITVSQVLGTAAMLDGFVVRGLDQTGLSQKAGPVVSDLRLSRGDVPASNHANSSGVDCLLAFDLLVAASDTHRVGADSSRTIVVASVAATATGAMVAHPTTPYPALDALTGRLDEVSRADQNRYVDAAALATGLFGDTTTANVLLLGVAVQAGAVAVSPAAVERAIELNGVAVARNVAAFRWGRRWVAFPVEVEQAAGIATRPAPRRSSSSSTASPPTSSATSRSATPGGSWTSSRRRSGPSRASIRRARRSPRPCPPRVQADGVQGRVRGRPPAARAGGARRVRGGRRSGHQGDVAPAPADAAGDGPAGEVEAGAAQPAGPGHAGALEAAARHARRPLPLGRGPQAGAHHGARVRAGRRRMARSLSAANLAEAVQIASLPDQVRGFEHLKLARANAYRAELAARLAAFR
jgi:indolepyruvate ferredoxin oxidoreductase